MDFPGSTGAAVAVQYRDSRFYIDDSDISSKYTFMRLERAGAGSLDAANAQSASCTLRPSAADAFDVDPVVFKQTVEHAPGEGAVRTPTLQCKLDDLSVMRRHGYSVSCD